MQDNYYQIYLNSVIELAETIVIKSDYSAQTQNQMLTYTHPGSFDPDDRTTWRYYLNLAGMYHPADTPMTVVSLDTLETIEFNRENLETHRATWRAYQYGSRYFEELRAQYPDQIQLILGVLYPVELEHAINAPEYSILGWPDHLVEVHETTLMTELEQWIQRSMSRWNNADYRITDDLYESVMFGIVCMNIVPMVLNLRLERRHTDEVHTYHITEYLGSHGYLDRFIQVMTRYQQLYFYRNIRLIQRNMGQQRTFGWLTENALTVRHIPLTSYTMTHNTEGLYEDMGPLVPKDFQVAFKKSSENPVGPQVHPVTLSTELMLKKEDPLARFNEDTRIQETAKIQEQFYYSKSNRVLTKVLESSMTDYSNSSEHPIDDVLLDHWLHWSYNGIYTTYISVTNPRTSEVVSLSAFDAFIFATYLSAYSIGIELKDIPTVRAKRFQLIPTPTPEDLLTVADRDYVDLNDARELLRYQPQIIPIISTEAFHEKCMEIFLASNHQWNVAAYEEHFMRRAFLEAMTYRIYGTQELDLAKGGDTSYTNWFAQRGIEINDFTNEEPDRQYAAIYRQATGLDLASTSSVKNVQAKMIQMFSELSSYSIQFLSEINDGRLIIVGWPVTRVGDINSWISSHFAHVPVNVDVLDYWATMRALFYYDLGDSLNILDWRASLKADMRLELRRLIHFHMDNTMRQDYFINTAHVGVSFDYRHRHRLPPGVVEVPGIDIYLAMSESDRRKVYTIDSTSLT